MKNNKLNNEYIAGFVHGDGSFTVNLNITKKKDIVKIYLSPVFIITQHKRNLELMKQIFSTFNNVGFYKIDNKNIIRYQVKNLTSLKEVIIPFFSKYQVQHEKLLMFIKFKFIVEKLSFIENKGFNNNLSNSNNDLLLDLITISVNMNKNVKPSIQLKYLSEIDRERVLGNKLSPEINKELENYISEFNKINILNTEFINGLFDSDG